jgi:hypothetical protein
LPRAQKRQKSPSPTVRDANDEGKKSPPSCYHRRRPLLSSSVATASSVDPPVPSPSTATASSVAAPVPVGPGHGRAAQLRGGALGGSGRRRRRVALWLEKAPRAAAASAASPVDTARRGGAPRQRSRGGRDGGAEELTWRRYNSVGADSSFTAVDSSFTVVNSSFSRLATAELSSRPPPPPLEPARLCLRGERGCNFAFSLSSIGSLPHPLQPLLEAILAMRSSQRERKMLFPPAVGLEISICI